MRFRSGCVIKSVALVTCVTSVLFWWRVYLFSNHADDGSHGIRSVILTKENSPFLNVGRRFNPKFLGMHHNIKDVQINGNNTLARNVSIELEDDAFNKVKRSFDTNNDDSAVVNYNVHAFYYSWYGNPGQDGKYLHWDHKYLPHWDSKISAKYPTGQAHVPPDDIGSSFYPLLGPYSSLDESVTRSHMMQMQQAGIGVLALSWYPPEKADSEGQPNESYVSTIFDIADQYNIKVCFHIEPYDGRTAGSVRDNLKYIIEKYGGHPAFYRHHRKVKDLPLVYIYDSYMIPNEEWKSLLSADGLITIRGTNLDVIAIGLLVERKHLSLLGDAGFDGIYTYFAANGFSYGSTQKNWKKIAALAEARGLMFIPSVGPGYDDLKVRPWNGVNVRLRNNGTYYDQSWSLAISSPHVSIVSITSFNEWHEGTQIEPASAISQHGGFTYKTYEPFDPNYYLDSTKKWVLQLLKQNKKSQL